MAYTILKSDGTQLVTITDGSLDTTTSLNLPGPNYVGYGDKLNENLVYLLENFSSNTAPGGTNLLGQLWYDKYNQKLKVFTTTGYKAVNGTVNASLVPTSPSDGDIWFNTITDQSYIYDNGQYKLVGPQYTKQLGISGAIPAVLDDATTTGTTHNVIKFQVGNVLIGTMSADISYVPTPSITGFPRIQPGLTFNNTFSSNINANINGVVFGSLIGGVTGNVLGNVTGNLTGDVTGNISGIVTGTVVGNVTGNITSVSGSITNLSSTNVTIRGGVATGLSNVTTSIATVTQLNTTTAALTNVSSANAQITGGNATSLTNTSATTAQATNFSSGNIVVTGGTALGLANIQATTAYFGGVTTGTISVTGGSLSGLTTLSATTVQATNFSSGNAQITGGNLTGVTLSGVTQATSLSTSNAQVTGGNISGIVGANNTFTSANLVNSTATTKTYSDSSTAIATTAFVSSSVPRGIILMWNSTSATIPTGFQLCDGSNGTADLRDRFIVGAGTTYSFGATGGANTNTLTLANLPTHTHTATSTFTGTALGSHSHSISDPGHYHYTGSSDGIGSGRGGGDAGNKEMADDWNAGNGPRVYTNTVNTGITVASGSAGTPAGSVATTVANTGASIPDSIDNKPLYFALCYIQKMF